MRIVILGLIFGFTALVANAQQAPVCVSQETADKCYNAIDTVKAQEKQIEALNKAIEERDSIIGDLKIKLAVESQKAVDKDAEVLRMLAIIESLMKSYTKPKKWGLIVF
jgi:hypothetical protein